MLRISALVPKVLLKKYFVWSIMKKLKCAVVGATGVAGQQFIEGLHNHPWFEVTHLFASEKSAGKKYRDAAVWHSQGDCPERIKEMAVLSTDKIEAKAAEVDVFFSALPSDVAKEVEARCARHKPTISTAAAYRYDNDVPILVPEVNSAQAGLVKKQSARGWKGFVVPGPNCTVTGLAVALKPIMENFGIRKVIMTSLQALSGAGYPGVASMDILDNVIPFISKEEEKVKKELLKLIPGKYKVGCTCTRVNVFDGHTETVIVETEKKCSPEDLKKAVAKFNEECARKFGKLPSAPKETIVIKAEDNRPQPRKDRDTYNGMATIIGRIRTEDVFDNGIAFVLLSHNTKKGAALGEIFTAEYLHSEGYF